MRRRQKRLLLLLLLLPLLLHHQSGSKHKCSFALVARHWKKLNQRTQQMMSALMLGSVIGR